MSRPGKALTPVLVELWEANYRVYGVRKLWKAAQRAGHDDVGRDQVARLMRGAGIRGAQPSRRVRTTMVLDALEMARWSRGTTLPGVRCHSEAGSHSRASATGNACPNSVRCPVSAASATASITRWPRV